MGSDKKCIIKIMIIAVFVTLLLTSCNGVQDKNGIEGVWYKTEELPENHTMEFYSNGSYKGIDIDYEGVKTESKGKYTVEDDLVFISYENQYGELEDPMECYIVDYYGSKAIQTDSFIYDEKDGSETDCTLTILCRTQDAAGKAYEENLNSDGRKLEYTYIKPQEYKIKGIKDPVMPHDFEINPDGIEKVVVINQKKLKAEEFALDYYNKCIKPYHPTVHWVCNVGDGTTTCIYKCDGDEIEVGVFPFEKGDEYSLETLGNEDSLKLLYINLETGKIRHVF